MAGKPELLAYQVAEAIGQDFLLTYQCAVLLALQRQGILNETQFRDCVKGLERKINQNV